MNRIRRSSGSMGLTALALVLGVSFSAVCISLAVQLRGLRDEVLRMEAALVAIDDVRRMMSGLDEIALTPAEPEASARVARWHELFAGTLARLDELGPPETLHPVVRHELSKIRAALAAVNELGLQLASAGPGDPQVHETRRAFLQNHQTAHQQFSASVREIRFQTVQIASRLRRLWGGLFVLSGLSGGIVIVLILLLNRARLDTARHKGAEQELRASEKRLASVLAAVPDLFLVLSADGRYREIYTGDEDLLVSSREELLGRTIHECIPAAVAARVQEVVDRALDDGTMQSLDYTLPIGGQERSFSARVVTLNTPDDPRVLFLSRDVTESLRAQRLLLENQQALRDREEQFRSVIDTANDAVIVADHSGTITLWNKASEATFGYTADESIGRSIAMIMPQRYRDIHAERLRHAAGSPQVQVGRTLELHGQRKDGTEFPIELSITSWGSTQGLFFTGIIRDITERKQAEKALREREERLRQVTDNIREVFWMTSADGQEVTFVSPAYEEVWGRSCESLYEDPLSWSRAIHEDDRPRIQEAFYGNARHGYDEEYRVVRPDGSERWIRDRGFPIRDDDGQVRRIAGIAEDITQRKLAEEALREVNEQLERRVGDRTAELRHANEQLQRENAERVRAESIQRERSRVLQALASGAPLHEVLGVLLDGIDEVYPNMMCSVLLLDEEGRHLRHGAARRLPDFYTTAVDGLEIGLGAGSCGTAAATGRRVVVTDVLSHPYWKDYREVARQVGFRACWSEPIMSSDGGILGTFALYYHEPRCPSDDDVEFIRSAADIAGIAIERRRAEAKLAESRERLRVADRMVALGTMAAGLGHDMNNVLFPIRCRLDALDWESISPSMRELLESARDSVEFLQHLCNGLRLFAADPEDSRATLDVTSLQAWWLDVEPLISKMVPDSVRIETRIPGGLPLVALAPHQLTQAIMNLVVNAAEAMPGGGSIRIWAAGNGTGEGVRVGVTDTGVGMSEQVRQRAPDPFYTTKTRSLSTGLGLSLALGLVHRAGGSVSINSAPGRGTTVSLSLPAARRAATSAADRVNGTRERAAVSLRDLRTAAWVTYVLESVGYTVAVAEDGDPRDNDLWVTEPMDENLAAARAFINGDGERRIIALGSAGGPWTELGAVVVENVADLEQIKTAVRDVTPAQQ